MKLDKATIKELAVRPGMPAALGARGTESTTVNWLGATKAKKRKEMAEEDLQSFVHELEASQELLWANGTHGLLVVLQAMDAAGKDGTIKHVMSGVNPQGCDVTAFKQPSTEELGHDFLWRAAQALPERGRIGIFNRSYYEEVLVVRVHPELLARGGPVSGKKPAKTVWQERYADINAFEHHLHRNGTRVVKIFLHVSKEEQKKRFLDRLDDPAKYWKFSAADLAERGHWDDYMPPTRKRSRPPPPPGRHGTWCRRTTSTPCGPWWAGSWSTPSTRWTYRSRRSPRTAWRLWPGPRRNCWPSSARWALSGHLRKGRGKGREWATAMRAWPAPTRSCSSAPRATSLTK